LASVKVSSHITLKHAIFILTEFIQSNIAATFRVFEHDDISSVDELNS
jgi:hypothetical protein